MARLRKAKCYRNVERSYTRASKYKKRNFIKAVPPSKIIRFDMGDLTKDFPYEVNLSAKEPIQIRNNALESARMLINRRLSSILGNKGYKFKIKVYPHHILRENKMLEGAGADRMSKGMKKAFGRPVGTAAQLKKGQVLMTAYVEEKDIETAKNALKYARARLPGHCDITANKRKI